MTYEYNSKQVDWTYNFKHVICKENCNKVVSLSIFQSVIEKRQCIMQLNKCDVTKVFVQRQLTNLVVKGNVQWFKGMFEFECKRKCDTVLWNI